MKPIKNNKKIKTMRTIRYFLIFLLISFIPEQLFATCSSEGFPLDGSCDGNDGVPTATECDLGGCVFMDCGGVCVCATECTATCSAGDYYSGGSCVDCPTYSDSNSGVYSGLYGSKSPFEITDCYIPTTGSITDSRGTFKFIGACYYSL